MEITKKLYDENKKKIDTVIHEKPNAELVISLIEQLDLEELQKLNKYYDISDDCVTLDEFKNYCDKFEYCELCPLMYL